MNDSPESNKKLDATKHINDYSIDELNIAYKIHVEKQMAQLDLEEPAFREIDKPNHRRSAKSNLSPNLMVIDLLNKVSRLLRFISKHLSKKYKKHQVLYTKLFLVGGLGILLLLIVNIAYVLIIPENITFSFSKAETCIVSPSLLPDFLHYPKTTTFRINRPSSWSISSVTIFSDHLCASPNKGPMSDSKYVSKQSTNVLGSLKINKTVTVVTLEYPALKATNLTVLKSQNLSLIHPLQFDLLTLDKTFSYALSVNGKTSVCNHQDLLLTCKLQPLDLAYDTKYQLALVREFKNQVVSQAYSSAIQTITAVAITQTSISPSSTVYSVPTNITFETNKPLINLAGATLSYSSNNKTTQVPITAKYSGNNITVSFASPLPRQTQFNLQITNVTASDQSQFEQPYNLSFSTSGGPAVTGSNIPSFGLASGQAMEVNFNQSLNSSQDPSAYTSVDVNGALVSADVSVSGSILTVIPNVSYPVCATVVVTLTAAAESQYGVSGNSAWSYTTRSHCYTTFSIGTSVQGRPITAYQFGSGSSMILFIAAMEGNEQNSSELLSQWIPNIDANPGKIPSWRTLVIIPTINPDGFAADNRLNADGVDLNRNFPANNWSEQVTEPTAPSVWTNDGGPYPLSEPESQAIATYTQDNSPTLTLTMHSHGGIVEANDAGDSVTLGADYASLADYQAIPTSAIGNFFDYTTTGAYEDWLNNKLNLPALEVELESATNDEYSRNLPALWAMAQIPAN